MSFGIGVLSAADVVGPDGQDTGLVQFQVLNLTGPNAFPDDGFVLPDVTFDGLLTLFGTVNAAGQVLPTPALLYGEFFTLPTAIGIFSTDQSGAHLFTEARVQINMPSVMFDFGGNTWQTATTAFATLTLPGLASVGFPDPVVIFVDAESVPTAVPEPATVLLLGSGAAAGAIRRLRRNKA